MNLTNTNTNTNKRLASAFYWGSRVISNIDKGTDNYVIISKVQRIVSSLHSITLSKSLSRIQMAEKLTELVNSEIDTMDVLLSFLNTNFNYLSCILSMEAPLVLYPSLHGISNVDNIKLYLENLDEQTQVIKVEDLGFIPLNQYTEISEWRKFISEEIVYYDIALDYELSDNGVFSMEDGTATLISIDGWHPEYSIGNMNDYLTTMLTNLFESAPLNKIQNLISDWMIKCNIDNYYEPFKDLFQISSQEEVSDAIYEMLNDFGYYNFVNFINLLTHIANDLSSTHGFKVVSWTGYSQGESGLILYEYNKRMFVPTENQDSYFTAVARGDSWYKEDKK